MVARRVSRSRRRLRVSVRAGRSNQHTVNRYVEAADKSRWWGGAVTCDGRDRGTVRCAGFGGVCAPSCVFVRAARGGLDGATGDNSARRVGQYGHGAVARATVVDRRRSGCGFWCTRRGQLRRRVRPHGRLLHSPARSRHCIRDPRRLAGPDRRSDRGVVLGIRSSREGLGDKGVRSWRRSLFPVRAGDMSQRCRRMGTRQVLRLSGAQLQGGGWRRRRGCGDSVHCTGMPHPLQPSPSSSNLSS